MRTTLTLDPDVARMLEDETHRSRRPFKQVVNDAIRRGLGPGQPGDTVPPYKVKPHRTTLMPGIDAASFNRLADELEDEVVMGRLATSG